MPLLLPALVPLAEEEINYAQCCLCKLLFITHMLNPVG
jgi:hypothetical protein